ncbi:MAG: sigma-54-dependent Fis family transcriptional regulator [Nitrospirae bacterium]|nr:sigma-54-dependent Fis family transcriptional regulator [Nitrospirota bacterium]
MEKGKILIIDDEDIVLRSCQRALSPAGYDVRVAKNGIDGLKMLETEAFAVVLTDLKMPDLDGIEVLRRIRETWPDIEVIIITGYQTVETAVKAIKLGAFDYIEKPFSPEQILSVIRNAIERRTKQ